MDKQTILWILGGGSALIAVSVVINITIINPQANDQPENPSGIAIPTQAERQANDQLCASIQEKIDAAGRPGWDGLGEELQEDVAAARENCTFRGDGKQF